jgi:hypothetical protein
MEEVLEFVGRIEEWREAWFCDFLTHYGSLGNAAEVRREA